MTWIHWRETEDGFIRRAAEFFRASARAFSLFLALPLSFIYASDLECELRGMSCLIP